MGTKKTEARTNASADGSIISGEPLRPKPEKAASVIEALDKDGLLDFIADLMRAGEFEQAKRIVHRYNLTTENPDGN